MLKTMPFAIQRKCKLVTYSLSRYGFVVEKWRKNIFQIRSILLRYESNGISSSSIGIEGNGMILSFAIDDVKRE